MYFAVFVTQELNNDSNMLENSFLVKCACVGCAGCNAFNKIIAYRSCGFLGEKTYGARVFECVYAKIHAGLSDLQTCRIREGEGSEMNLVVGKHLHVSYVLLVFAVGLAALIWGVANIVIIMDFSNVWEKAHEDYHEDLRLEIAKVKQGSRLELLDACNVSNISGAVVMEEALRSYANKRIRPLWCIGLGLGLMCGALCLLSYVRDKRTCV